MPWRTGPRSAAECPDGGGRQRCPVDTSRAASGNGGANEGTRRWGGGRLTCFTSCGVYSMVRMIITRSSRSRGMPWGEVMSSVPLQGPRRPRHPGLSETGNQTPGAWLR